MDQAAPSCLSETVVVPETTMALTVFRASASTCDFDALPCRRRARLARSYAERLSCVQTGRLRSRRYMRAGSHPYEGVVSSLAGFAERGPSKPRQLAFQENSNESRKPRC